MTEPGWLALEPDPVLVTLEATARPSPPVAVLICPPFGWEEMTSHRALRAWAQALAEAGYPTARIDLPSSGDSGGHPGEAGRLAAWCSAVSNAASWLADRTACGRVAALGVGLGGLVATQVAAQPNSAIDDLLLWAVPARGKTLMRELRARGAIIAARHSQYVEPRLNGSAPVAPGDAELIGFRMSAETIESLQGVDLAALQFPDAGPRRALLLTRDRLPIDDRLRRHLEASGFDVAVQPGEGYDALIADPQEAATPHRTIAASAQWLAAEAPPGARAARAGPVAWHSTAVIRTLTSQVRETVFEIELPRGTAMAVATEPMERGREDLCAVLWPAGALRRTGPSRVWVEAARRWGARGVSTVRIDLPGIGDGAGDGPARVSNADLYTEERDAEVAQILQHLPHRGLPGRFVLGGLCSGAYWSLHAALTDPRVMGLLMLNLYSFWWSPELVAEREPGTTLSELRAGAWRRVFRRDVSRERLMTALASVHPRRLLAGRHRSIEGEHALLMEQTLDRLRDQNVTALMLFSQGEPLLDQMVRQGHIDQVGRWPNLRVEELPSRDHMFRALWLQAHVHARLDAGLERVLPRSG